MRALALAAPAVRLTALLHSSAWIFPEGTRNRVDPEQLLPFKKGAFHVAVQSGCPIVPVVMSNQRYCFQREGDNLHWTGGTILLRALPAIKTAGKTAEDVDALIAQTRSAMQVAIEELNVEARKLNGISKE